MGTEAIVEVHTPNELYFALSRGATIFLVNMWDRTTGRLYPDQVFSTVTRTKQHSFVVTRYGAYRVM